VSCGRGTIRFSFDRTNPEAVRWARARSARLVTEVTAEARQAIRAVVERSFVEGIPPRESARLIRSIVGLTERDAMAVMNHQLELLSRGTTQARALASAERYAEKLTRRRALTIARTETMAASNAGQQALWDQAVRRGKLDQNGVRKVWLTTYDERLCSICAPMEGMMRTIADTFPEGDPPIHPLCRCTVGLVSAPGRRGGVL
jgi:hypothetical protein